MTYPQTRDYVYLRFNNRLYCRSLWFYHEYFDLLEIKQAWFLRYSTDMTIKMELYNE